MNSEKGIWHSILGCLVIYLLVLGNVAFAGAGASPLFDNGDLQPLVVNSQQSEICENVTRQECLNDTVAQCFNETKKECINETLEECYDDIVGNETVEICEDVFVESCKDNILERCEDVLSEVCNEITSVECYNVTENEEDNESFDIEENQSSLELNNGSFDNFTVEINQSNEDEVIVELNNDIDTGSFSLNSSFSEIEGENVTEFIDEKELKIELSQGFAEVGEEVLWTKRVYGVNESYEVDIPSDARRVSEKFVPLVIDSQSLSLGLQSTGIENNEELEVVVNESYVEVEYKTSPPNIESRDISDGKEVLVWSENHLENVYAWTELDESFFIRDEREVVINWIEEGRKIGPKVLRDRDGNGIYDYVGWNVPHLSNQTFEIIVINVAEHLDENRNFIENIYFDIKDRDGVWSSEISDGEYVRVVFEENLDYTNDITVYARGVLGNPFIEVYEKDSNVLIAEFNPLIDNIKNTVYLNSLLGSQDTFDLKVVNGSVQFDYIVDPDLDSTYNFSSYVEATNGDWIYESNNGGSWVNVGLANEPSANGNAPQWQWVSNGGSASSGTGPPAGYSCVFPETSSPVSAGDEARITLQNNVSADTYDLFVTFDHSTYGVATGYTYFEAWNGTSYNVIDSWPGDSNTAMQSEGPYDFSGTGYAYTNDDFHIRFRILVGSTAYQSDFAIDSVRVYGNFSNIAPSVPNSLTCNGATCDIVIDEEVELDCSGSVDPEGDTITYFINDSNGYIGNHTNGSSFVWNTTLFPEVDFVNFTCEAFDLDGSNESSGTYFYPTNLRIDHTNPIVNFSSGTYGDGTFINSNSIFVNVSLNESNFKNITFNLYTSSSLLSSDSYTGSTRSVTWNELSSQIYFYNVTVWDKAGNVGYSETRNVTIDKSNPYGTTQSPSSGSHSNNNNQNLTVSVSDSIGLKEAILSIFNSSGSLINTTTVTLSGLAATIGVVYSFSTDGIYNWFYRIFDLADNFYDTANSTIVIDTQSSLISLESVLNNSGDSDGNLVFDYNVSDSLSGVDNCSLILNEIIYDTDTSVVSDIVQSFSVNELSVGTYNWSVLCYDDAGNLGQSNTRYFDVISVSDFSGESTDLSLVDLSNVGNFVLEKLGVGKISYNENLDLRGVLNFDSLVVISDGVISVDSLSEEALNASATIEMYNLNYEFIPLIFKDGVLCSDCDINSYSEGNLSFNVTSFSSYTLGENSYLSIFDDTDSSTYYPDDEILFYANYTNRTDGSFISGGSCNITFDDGTYLMSYNSTSFMYEYNRSFSLYSVYDYNVSCFGSNQGYENLSVSDSAVVTFPSSASYLGYKTQSGIYNLVGLDEFIPLTYPVLDLNHAFIIAPNKMNQENTTQGTNGDAATNSDDSFVSLYLYNTTHIRARRSVSDDGPVVVTWQVLEATDNEFEVQRGEVEYSGTDLVVSDIIPNPVNPDNSMSWFYINTTYNANRGDVIQFYSNITNSTGITFIREDTAVSTEITFNWEVVEWNLSKINNFRKGYTGEITGDDSSPDCFSVGASINKSSSLLFSQSHAIDDNDGGLDTSTRAQYIQDDNTVCFYDYDGIYTAGVKWFLIDVPGVTQREEDFNTLWLSGDYSEYVTFTGNYDINNSLFWLSGTCNGDGTAKPRHTFWWNFSSTGASIERVYSGQDTEYAWQIVELPSYENLDSPLFSDFFVNSTLVRGGDSVKFNLTVMDSSDSIDWTKGIIAGVERDFVQGNGDEWYYEYVCSGDSLISFTYVSSQDDGYPIKGNSSSVEGVNVTCDSTAPVLNFVSPDTPIDLAQGTGTFFDIDVDLIENNFWNISYNLFNSTGSLIQSANFTNETLSHRFSGLSSGLYYYNVTVYDKVGYSVSTETRSITFDNNAPLISYSNGMYDDGDLVSSDEIFVNVTVVEPNFNNLTFYLYDDFMQEERTPVSYTGSTRSLTWTLLSDGLYYYNVDVYDTFGNYNFTQMRNVTLDQTDPVVAFNGVTKADNYYYDRDFISAEVSIVELHFTNVTFELWNSSGIVDSTTYTDNTRTITWNNLVDGIYYYNVSSFDDAGNLGYTETRTITLDKLNPVVIYGVGVEADLAVVNKTSIFVNVSVIETNFLNITFELYDENELLIDSQSFTDSTRDYTFIPLSSDLYKYKVIVIDKANNIGESTIRTITLDTNSPVVNIISPEAIAYGIDSGLILNFTSTDEFSTLDSCWWNIDDGINQSIICSGDTTFDTTNGGHTINVYSNDSFGYVGIDSVNFLISTGGPAIVLSAPENDTFYSEATNVIFNYSATDVQGVDSCSLWGDWNGGWHLNQTDDLWDFGTPGNEFNDWESYADSDATLSGSVWQNVAGDNCDVMTDSAGTPSTGTGPNIDHTLGSTSGEYLYLETSAGYCQGNGLYAELNGTQILDADTYLYNVSFWYHMFGSVMGSLHLDVYNGTWQNSYWSISGEQHSSETDPYTQAIVDLSEFSGDIYVRFRFVSGGDFYSDIAIDDLDIVWEPRIVKDAGNFSVNLTEEGSYKWNVECNDTLGLIEAALNNYTIAIDTIAPQVDFGNGVLPGGSRVGVNYIFVNASVTESNLDNVIFSLYDQMSAEVQSVVYSDGTLNHTFTGLSSGIYYYNFTVYDKASRSNSSETRMIEIDLINPTGNLISPTNDYFTGNNTHNFTANFTDLVELSNATFFIYNSTSGLVYSEDIDLSGLTFSEVGISYTFLYDDVFDWFYSVRDSVGNEYNLSSYQIEIDTTSPVITFIPPTEDDGVAILRDWIYLNTSVYEKNYKNITFRLYDFNGLKYKNEFSTALRELNWTLLPDGVYYYNVSSYDLAGNLGVSETRSIILDDTNPVVDFTVGTEDDNSVISGDTIFVNVSVVESNEANITFDLYDVNNISERSNSFVDGRRTATWTLLPSGIYYYNVTVYDDVGLIGYSETRKITLDNTNPVVNYGNNVDVNNANKSQEWIFVNVTFVEENFRNVTFWLYDEGESLIDEQSFSGVTSEYNFTSLSDGIYYYNVTVYDLANNFGVTSTRKISLDNTEPLVNFVFPTEDDYVIRNRDWVYLNISYIENNFREISFSLYDSGGLYSEQVFTDGTSGYNFTGLSDNNYEYNVTVVDWAGNANTTDVRHIGLDSSGPVVNIIKPKSKTYGTNESLILEHSVSDTVSSLDSCWWNLDGGVNQSVVCNEVTTFNTTVAPHTLNFYANDSFGNVGYDSVSFFISITGPAIELISPENDTFYSAATNVNFSFTANDPDSVDSCSLYGDWGVGWEEKNLYTGDWNDVGYKYRRDINLTNTGTTTLLDFPVYLNISYSHTDVGDYSDLRFFNGSCDSLGASLYYDLDGYDTSSANVWVKIPNFVVGDNVICMYYGNSDAESLEDPLNVWTQSYTSVYHLEHTSGIAVDELGNFDAEDGIDPDSNMNVLGSVGGADYFDGNDYLGTNPEWDVDGAHTYCTWVKFSGAHNGVILEDGGQTDGTGLGVTSAGALRYAECYNGNFYPMDTGSGYNDNQWHYLCGGHTGTDQFLYVDGEFVNSITQGDGLSGTGDARIGQSVNGNPVFDNANIDSFTGYLDEIRVSSIARSGDWINQSYLQVAAQDSIVSYGSEELFVGFSEIVSSEGDYLWNVICNDTVGYVSSALENYTFIVDVTDPIVLFGPGTEDNNTVVGVDWINIDSQVIENNFLNISFYLYNQTGGSVDFVTFSDDTREYNFTNLPSGVYYYNMTVFDKADRIGSSETRVIKLDLSSPIGSLLSPATGSYLNDVSQNLTANFSDATGLLNATLYVLNETGHLIYSQVVNLGGALTATVGVVYNFLTEGIYSWFYSVRDVVGNEVNLSSNNLIIDLTNPSIDYSFGVEESGTIFERENIYVNVTSDDLYWANLTFNLYNPSGLVFAHSFTDAKREINWTLLPDNVYEYNVTAYDFSGNSNSTGTRNITLDNLDPIISFTSSTKPNGDFVSGDSISVYVNVIEANEDNITFNLYNSTGYNIRSNSYVDGRRTVTWNLLDEGTYYYNVTVYDKVGHVDYTNTRSIIVDNTNPGIVYAFGTESDLTSFQRDWVFFRVTVTEDNFDNVTLSLYNESGFIEGYSFVDTTREYNFTGLVDGTYYYNATVYDKAGNSNSTLTRSQILDNVDPVVNFVAPTEIDNFNKTDDWVFVNVSYTELNLKNITFELFDSSGILLNSTVYTNGISEINFTGLSSDVYYYNVTVYDLAGNYDFTEARKIGLDYIGPSISIINPKAKAYGYNISLPLDYNVYDLIVGTDVCWYNIDGGLNVTVDCSSSSNFNTSDGQHTLNFYANDTFGNMGYRNVTFLVSITGPAIQLIDPEDNTFYAAATEVFFNFTAEDPDLTESCSLWGSWNGGWHLNQTDSDWIIGDTNNDTEDFETYVSGDTVFTLNWSNTLVGDSCSWHADNGGTASGGTGPSVDHTLGNSAGIYAYIETSTSPPTGIDDACTAAGQEAYLLSDVLNADFNNYNISFWYHMYGPTMGDLNLDVYDGSWQNSVWSASGNLGDVWNNAVVDLSDYEGDIQLRFRGSKGGIDSDYQSDMALDDIIIITTPGGNKPSGNFTLNLSEEGTHEWNVLCNDTKGYVTSAVSNYSISFDVTNPVVDFGLNTLADNSNVSQNYIYLNSSIVENNFKEMEFYLYDENGVLNRSAWFNDSTRDYTFTNVPDGIYYYNITVWDGADRNGSSPTRKILLDTASPLGALISPNDNSIVNNATQNLSASFNDENGLLEAVLYVFNQTGYVYSQVVNLGGELSSTIGILYTFLLDGVYDWFYQVEDNVGNLYNTTNNSITVDTTLPIVNFVPETLSNNSYVVADNIYLNTSVVETNFKNITFVLYNGESVVAPSPNVFTSSKRDINWTNLPDDEYFYNVTVWDKAGNVNFSETRVISLDNVLPVVSYGVGVESNYANKSRDWIFVNTSVVETNFDNITFRLYDGEGLVRNVTFNDTTRSYNFTGLFDDEYFYNVTVWDKAGQSKSTATREITLDDTLPLVEFGAGTASDGAVFERDWIYITSNIFETNFRNMTFTLYDNESQVINATSYNSLVPSINFTASGENNTYFYNIEVYDYSGNRGVSQTRNITLIDITSPSLVMSSPENITYPYYEGIRLEYQVIDSHVDTCWYVLDSGSPIILNNCQGASLNFVDETGHTLELYVNDTMGYMNNTNVTFAVNSSLIETPTYKTITGSSFVDGSTTETIEITDMSKSFILHTSRGSDNGPDTLQIVSSFPRSDEVEFSNYNAGAGAIVDWVVVSGPNISVQRGEIDATTSISATETINPVNLSNSFIVVNGKVNSGASIDNVDGFWRAEFSDDSNLYFERGDNSADSVISWQVISWEGINSQSGFVNLSAGAISSVESISQVDFNKSILLFSYSVSGDDDVNDVFVRGTFSSDSELNFSRVGNGGIVNITYYVLSSDLFDVQNGVYTHLENSNVQPIGLSNDLINVGRSFDVHSHENDGIINNFASGFVTQTIYDNNTINLQKGVGSDSGVTSWFAVEMRDLNNPFVNLDSPIENYNYTSHFVGPFTYSIEDESNMSNCSLYGTWNSGWHLNQTVYNVDVDNPTAFSSVDVGVSGFYNWSVECYDIYGNSFITENRTFSSFLPPTEPQFVNITQTSNDGNGDIVLFWNATNDTSVYNIYYSNNLSDFSLLAETTDTNYTDTTFSGEKRRFYRVESWNPSSANMSNEIFGAHVYEFNYNNVNPAGGITNRNWVGFPTDFSYVKTANDTLNEVNGITSISRLKTDTQTEQSCNEFSCPDSFSCTDTACNFNITAGEGYEILLNESGSSQVNWSGVGIVREPVMINLVYDETGTRFNKNWISMYAGTTLGKASNLGDSILGEDAITSWNSELQKSEGKIGEVCLPIGCVPIGIDFNIEAEGGYEVSVLQDSGWMQE